LGIHQRSGTNYVYNLLKQHPSCAGPGPIWEDHFVQYSKPLRRYVETLYKAWNPKWKVTDKIGPQETLLRHFGDAIQSFLQLQLAEQTECDVLLTKTPSVAGLGSFFDLFPDAPLILIVRDGRALVESGVRSFGWKYENAMQSWSRGARAILDLRRAHESSSKKLLIVKYEDVFLNLEDELRRIFSFLELDPEQFDFGAAKSMGVIGSSEVKEQAGDVHWRATEKTAEFNPLTRFSNWDRKRHERFSWIAGRYLTEFGYPLDEGDGGKVLSTLRNRLLDVRWAVRTFAAQVYRGVMSLLKSEV